MIQLTKIFNFEMAHAIFGYPGVCKNIHGHSYELQVTVGTAETTVSFLPSPGFVMDFKEIKKTVTHCIIEQFDHKLLLSEAFIAANPVYLTHENLVAWQAEPTAENMLLYISETLQKKFSKPVQLVRLRLYETKDSFAEWLA